MVKVNRAHISGPRRRALMGSLLLAGGVAAVVAAWLTSVRDVAVALLVIALAVAFVFALHKIDNH